MAEFALLSLFTIPLLKEHTQHRLRIDAEGYLLRLNWFEKLGYLPFSILGCLLFFFLLRFFGSFSFGLRRLRLGCLSLNLLDLSLGLCTLFL